MKRTVAVALSALTLVGLAHMPAQAKPSGLRKAVGGIKRALRVRLHTGHHKK